MATVTFVKRQGQSAGALGNVTRYVCQDKKTLDKKHRWLVSGRNCTPQFAHQEFLTTRQMHRKDSPVWFYHYVQSFSPEEDLTGAQALEVAEEFAAQAWPESEVLIATHVDAQHIHSHFIVNAVCHENGRMLRQGPNTLKDLRKLSDEIYLAHHLSVLPPEQKNQRRGMTGREYRSAVKGQSWKFKLMSTIDECMRYAKTREEFLALMRSEGYDVRWTDARKNITYTTPDGLKCRDDRLHEEKYLKEAMEYEFAIRQAIVAGGVETAQSPNSAADPASDGGGMERSAASAGRTAAPHRGTGSGAVGAGRAVGDVSQPEEDRGAGAGCGGDSGGARTGWEAERTAAFSTAQHLSAGTAQAASVVATGDPGGAGVVGSVVRLGHALEHDPSGDAPVIDSTTRRSHTDSKTLKQERQKKIAHGHKEDDHEEGYPTMKQTMM